MSYVFSVGGLAGFHDALAYYGVTFATDDVRPYAAEIFAALEVATTRPELSPVVAVDEETGYEYRHVLVWKFYFFYRIEREELIVDLVAHESSDISRLSDL